MGTSVTNWGSTLTLVNMYIPPASSLYGPSTVEAYVDCLAEA